MDTPKLSELVLAVDLDDTLYQEFDYQTSGLLFVGEQLQALYGVDIKDRLLEWRARGCQDLWQQATQLLNLPASVAEQMLWMYRLHRPGIQLSDELSDLLTTLKPLVKKLVILTDGRSISQRQKLVALGLGDIPVYISEEYQSSKPSLDRFLAIMDDYSATTYVYIGDNPQKDFLAPNQLGWKSIGLVNHDPIHSQQCDHLSTVYHPNVWIESWRELLAIIEVICSLSQNDQQKASLTTPPYSQ
jgi:putative hydrolase of the HAD superfamily